MSSNRQQQPPLKEFIIPQAGVVSPVTGIQGTVNWGAINKPDQRSRWVIGDGDLDDLINMIPQGIQIQQVPYKGANIATLAATALWMQAYYLNGVPYLFCLCSNGGIYQVSTSGTITTVGTGFSTNPVCDIAQWQGSIIIISDPSAQKIYSWNGTTLTTVFSSQPNSHITVFQGRLWIAYNLTITWTQNNTYNSLTGDAGSFAISDNDADSPIYRLYAYPGSLIVFGSSYIKTISGLSDTGSPAVLIFGLTTLTSLVGTIFYQSVIAFGNVIYFANAYGIWALQGSYPVKISWQLDGFFQALNFTNTSFAACYGQIYDTPCLFWNVYYNGDTNVAAGYCLIGVTIIQGAPTQWFRVQQGTIVYITSVAANASTQLPTCWGTDGTNIFELFSSTSTSYNWTVNTKIWDVTGSKIDYKEFRALLLATVLTQVTSINVSVIGQSGSALTSLTAQSATPGVVTWVNENDATVTWINNIGAVVTWVTAASVGYYPFQYGFTITQRALGLNITGTGAQTIIQSLIVAYRDTPASWGP